MSTGCSEDEYSSKTVKFPTLLSVKPDWFFQNRVDYFDIPAERRPFLFPYLASFVLGRTSNVINDSGIFSPSYYFNYIQNICKCAFVTSLRLSDKILNRQDYNAAFDRFIDPPPPVYSKKLAETFERNRLYSDYGFPLPAEVLDKIFSYLPAPSLKNVSLVCTTWRDHINTRLHKYRIQTCIGLAIWSKDGNFRAQRVSYFDEMIVKTSIFRQPDLICIKYRYNRFHIIQINLPSEFTDVKKLQIPKFMTNSLRIIFDARLDRDEDIYRNLIDDINTSRFIRWVSFQFSEKTDQQQMDKLLPLLKVKAFSRLGRNRL